MEVCHTIDDVRSLLRERRQAGPVALVPTMGALHDGHLSLTHIARQWTGDAGTVAVSIFVNPTQFGPNEDFQAYPRPLEDDLAKCRQAEVDVVFAPSTAQIYAPDASIQVQENALSSRLCGASRPGHFAGVCTVVAALFNIVQPDAAVFGEKDFQQLAILRRMTRDLHFPVEILGAPIVRESDGLALSSRNTYLNPDERRQATVLFESLKRAEGQIHAGERDPAVICAQIERTIREAPGARIDYIEIVDPGDLTPIDPIRSRTLIALAVFWRDTRLIDNLCLRGLPE